MTRRARRIHVPDVPADLRIPRDWPIPTDRWVRENAFWQPPTGWAPLPDGNPAPHGWRFWTPNRLWISLTAPAFRPIAVGTRAAGILGLVSIAAMVAGALSGYPPLSRVIALAALLATAACIAVHEVLRARITRRLMGEFAVLGERARRERLVREYARYLMAVA